MTVNHHLDDATLVRYASGDLDDAFLLVVASHLAMCAHCRAAARNAEELGGQLLDGSETVAPENGSFESLVQRIELAEVRSHFTPEAAERESKFNPVPRVPAPLRRRIGDRLEDIRWRAVAPGVKKHSIRTDPDTGSALYMLWIAPGKAVPEHGHGGAELTLILSGAYRDDLGVFGPGDIADLDAHVEHQPRVMEGEPCVCLVATESPTRFKGILGRILQPFVGI